ncbi:hypothetical protein AGR2A_Cc10227 [Agrobacterium genomosp. 2 str. CFBP 5494]|uniref:Uncharacterized protein n=1 Tax=Agrobacterium genomosp. 2 str. CFBP 5494 TaxID=1183436 RepID=A0A9W5AXH3_9HYPH|nr:hypothetical protein AGR2A_Cc10227 [Agrobacterium genomosp. 2 str. CFBP 5494]
MAVEHDEQAPAQLQALQSQVMEA